MAEEINVKTSPASDEDHLSILKAAQHCTEFVPHDYLTSFYTSHLDDPAIGTLLCFLPRFVQRLCPCGDVLDVGSGPSVHMALAFRDGAQNIFLSDYVPCSRQALLSWQRDEPDQFDWTRIVEWLLCLEGLTDAQMYRITEHIEKAQQTARKKVTGILAVDVNKRNVIDKEKSVMLSSDKKIASQYDVVTSTFVIEFATETKEDYQNAVSNVLSLLKPGGTLLLGGLFHKRCYSFGKTKFTSFFLTDDVLLETLRMNGIDVDDVVTFHFIEKNGVFLLSGVKRI